MSFQQRLSITLVAIARIWRIIVSLWTVWLGFKHILGLPGDIDDAQQWQYLLKRWGMWDTLIDPRPWVFFVALGLTLWAWDVPQRIISRWRKPKLQFDLGGDPSIEKRTLDPTATYWVFDPVTILQKPGKGRENLNLDIELRIQPDPDTWLRFKRVRDPDGLPDPIVAGYQ